MEDPKSLNKSSVGSIFLLLLIWLLSLFAQNLFEVSPQTYHDIGAWLGYKKLLQISSTLLITVAILLILYFSKHLSSANVPSILEIKHEPKELKSKLLSNITENKEVKNNLTKEQLRLLNNLSDSEKWILDQYFSVSKKSLEHNVYDSSLHDLTRKNILFKPDDSLYGKGITYVIHEWAWAHLKEHPELLMSSVVKAVDSTFIELNDDQKLLLTYLDKNEKSVLKMFLKDDTKTLYISAFHPLYETIKKLASLKILIKDLDQQNNLGPMEQIVSLINIPYSIADWAWQYLKNNSNLLE